MNNDCAYMNSVVSSSAFRDGTNGTVWKCRRTVPKCRILSEQSSCGHWEQDLDGRSLLIHSGWNFKAISHQPNHKFMIYWSPGRPVSSVRASHHGLLRSVGLLRFDDFKKRLRRDGRFQESHGLLFAASQSSALDDDCLTCWREWRRRIKLPLTIIRF